jgi:hypothetical protein
VKQGRPVQIERVGEVEGKGYRIEKNWSMFSKAEVHYMLKLRMDL